MDLALGLTQVLEDLVETSGIGDRFAAWWDQKMLETHVAENQYQF